MTNRSMETRIIEIIKRIENKIRSVFNSEFFSAYEGIIEEIDSDDMILGVRIPELDDARFDNCRVLMPGVGSGAAIVPTFALNSHVIVLFKAFSLAEPIVIGQLAPINQKIIDLSPSDIVIKNGAGEIRIDSGGNITLSGVDIKIDGTTVVAGTNDLLVDDIGAL